MPEEDEDGPLEITESKCNTCRYGLCAKEKDLQVFFQPGMVEGNPFENESAQPGLNQVAFEVEKVRSVCFWRPVGMQHNIVSPLLFNCVTDCSKYEAN